MKKQLLCAAACIGFAVTTNAQTTVFSQDFEGDPQELFTQGWVITVAHGEESNYGVFTSMPAMQNIGFSGNAIGATTFHVEGTTPVHIPDTDIIITTPVINLPEGELTLSYRVGSLSTGGGSSSHYSVYIITTEDMQGVDTPAEMAAMLDGKWAEDSATISGESSTVSFTISEYGGAPAVVAMRLHDSPSNTALLFDDITITQGILGTGGFNTDSFAIYPNPAQNFIIINSNNYAGLESITIADMNGRIVNEQKYTGGNAAQMDISWLNSGMYLVTIASDKGTTTKKIIKQ